MALIETGAGSGLRSIRGRDDSHFYGSTFPQSGSGLSAEEARFQDSMTYVSPHFRTEGHFRVCPYISIARRLSSQLTWLPDKHDISIWRAIQIHPTHWGDLSNDPRSLNQVLNCSVEADLSKLGIGVAGDQMNMT